MTVTRREALALASAGLLPPRAPAQSLPQWECFELSFAGPSTGNPFTEVQFSATFTHGADTFTAEGFYDGAGQYKVRAMPHAQGEWTYTTASSTPALNAHTGRFTCTAPLAGAHGPVRVRAVHHFAYADGAPYYPFGTTCYAWIHQSEELQRETLDTLSKAPFNKIRMCVFPKHYEYNHNEPALYPFERNAAGVSDFTRPNPAFYAHLERRLADLRALGIESDLILFHPYDRWGYSKMPADADDRYLRYVVARLSAYRNIWWSLANEYDLMKAKTVQDFDRFFQIVAERDPVAHLRSVHNGRVLYDNTHPWVTHASLQTSDFAAAAGWLKAWQKPIVFDEVMYEGNLNRRWGNISSEEMVRRFWLGTLAGGYVTHGETYLDPAGDFDENATPTLWWSHGGKLRGTSAPRIAFLRKLLEEIGPLEAPADAYYLNATGPADILYYMDFHQPIYYEFPLPPGTFSAELIDPWTMTATPLEGRFSGKSKIKLSGRSYQAVRFRRV